MWEAHRGAFRWYIARVCDINFLPQCCQSTKPPAFSSPNGPPFPTWLPNLLSFLPVRKLLHRFCSILCPKCMASTRDTWYRLWRRHIYDSPVALTPRILLLCSKLFIGRTKFCGKGGTTPKVQLWNIFGRAHKKKKKNGDYYMMAKYNFLTRKKLCSCLAAVLVVGKMPQELWKMCCKKKKRRATFFGQQGGLCHENGVWHENVKNKKKPKKFKAKMWKKANKWSCCLGLNLAGETTLQIVWPMCAWCAKWGFFWACNKRRSVWMPESLGRGLLAATVWCAPFRIVYWTGASLLFYFTDVYI